MFILLTCLQIHLFKLMELDTNLSMQIDAITRNKCSWKHKDNAILDHFSIKSAVVLGFYRAWILYSGHDFVRLHQYRATCMLVYKIINRYSSSVRSSWRTLLCQCPHKDKNKYACLPGMMRQRAVLLANITFLMHIGCNEEDAT